MGSIFFIVSEIVTILSAIPLALPTCNSFTENGSAMIVATSSPLMALEVTTTSRLIAPRSTGTYVNVTFVVEAGEIVSVVCAGVISVSFTTILVISKGRVPTFLSCRLLV